MNEYEAAARAVAVRAGGTPRERKELLEMLGLIASADTSADLLPEPPKVKNPELPGINNSLDNAPHLNRQTPVAPPGDRLLEDRWRVPPGLRNLPPEVVKEVPKPAKCTRAAHVKRGEKLCDDCREAYNAYQRECRNKRIAAAS